MPLKLLHAIFNRLESPQAAGKAIFKLDEIPRSAEPFVQDLKIKGFMQAVQGKPTCMECGVETDINKSKSGDYSVCGGCGTVAKIQPHETVEYHISIAGLAAWLGQVLQFNDTPENIGHDIYHLGNYTHQNTEYELHLLPGLSWEDANTRLQTITEQLSHNAVALCLHMPRKPPQNAKIRLIGLHQCFSADISWRWPKGVFSEKDSTKQFAANQRVANDPLQICKAGLKVHLLSTTINHFRGLMHNEIAKKVRDEHPEWINYTDKHGNAKTLSKQLTLDAVKEVLEERNLTDQISGRKQPY